MYLWDLDHGFAGVILIKKAGDGSQKIKGCWDSIHVIEVQVKELHYLLQSKPFLTMKFNCKELNFQDTDFISLLCTIKLRFVAFLNSQMLYLSLTNKWAS